MGSCGNKIGDSFWQRLCNEHNIDGNGQFTGGPEKCLNKIGTCFDERMEGRFIPRSVHIDTDRTTLDEMMGHSSIRAVMRPDNFVHGSRSTGNNWGKGFYTDGRDMADECMDKIRKEIEICDSFESIQFTHSISGGTGSGLGSLLISKIKDEYHHRILQSFSVFSSPNISHNVLEPYNNVFTLHQLVENVDMVHIIDNEALMCGHKYRNNTNKCTIDDMNNIVSTAMSDTTSPYRFTGMLNSSVRKIATNLIPFPRLHFFVDSLSYVPPSIKPTEEEIISSVFNANNQLCTLDTANSRSFCGAGIFRGAVSSYSIDAYFKHYMSLRYDRYVEWIADSMNISMCDVSRCNDDISMMLIDNNKSQQNIYKRIGEQFTAMYRRKSFVHWYTGEGMDCMEFTEAESNCNDLVSEFSDGCIAYEEEDYE